MTGSTNSEGVWEYAGDGPPVDATLNLQATALTTLFSGRAHIKEVADTTARATYAATFTPSAANPAVVWRADASTGENLEVSTDGTNWHAIPFDTYSRIKQVADTTARTTYAATFTQSASDPAVVWRGDADAGEQLEVSTDGSTWDVYAPLRGEDTQSPTCTTGAMTVDTAIGVATAIASATYDRVVELSAAINISGITAGAAWQGVLTSDGSVISTNVVRKSRFPYNASAATLGGVMLHATFDLAAGSSVTPRLWVEELVGGGTLTISDATFDIRVRPEQ